jgi:hypothetical protein
LILATCRSEQFRVSSTLPRKLQELGLSPETALRRAGLPIGLFKLEKILVSTEDFFALHRGIAGFCRNPANTSRDAFFVIHDKNTV